MGPMVEALHNGTALATADEGNLRRPNDECEHGVRGAGSTVVGGYQVESVVSSWPTAGARSWFLCYRGVIGLRFVDVAPLLQALNVRFSGIVISPYVRKWPNGEVSWQIICRG